MDLSEYELRLLVAAIREKQSAMASSARPWAKDAARGNAEAIAWMADYERCSLAYLKLAIKLDP